MTRKSLGPELRKLRVSSHYEIGTMKSKFHALLPLAAIGGLVLSADAAITFTSTAPTADSLDISNANASVDDGLDPIVIDGATNKGVGQSILMGGTAGNLTAVTLRTRDAATNDYSGVSGTQTYEVRIGTFTGDYASFNVVSTQTITGSLSGLTNGDFITWTLDSAVTLNANTLYGVVVNGMDNVPRLDLAKNTVYDDGRVLYQNYNDWTTTPVLGGIGSNSGRDANFHMNITAVPEPSSIALIGLGGLALLRRRRR